MLSFVQQLPRYKVTVAQKGCRSKDTGVEVELEVHCSLEVPVGGSNVSNKSKGPRLGMTDIITLTSDLDLVDFRRTSLVLAFIIQLQDANTVLLFCKD